MKPKFYLTTPLYYANARPHVGSAYSTIVCDAIARYKRMRGFEVAYLTGTDEHGENIARAAAKLGISPKELVDRNSRVFRDLWKLLDISCTHFIRTTSPEHLNSVHRIVLQARDAGYIYKSRYQGRYCVHDNLYVTDSTEPADCPTCGRPAELVSEENYFFKLSAFQDKLLKLYEERPEFVQPDFRRNEVISFVKGGLRDISVSRRSVRWGIPWPEDEEQVVYVWYDALTGYMTGIGYGDDEVQWEKWWGATEDDPDRSHVLHVIGKEIIRFHCVYWPAFLMAAGEPLPKQIFAHGWLLFDQQKMSKSKGNVAYAEPVVRVLGIDALRYYLLRDVVFGQDGNYSLDALLTRYNSDLANDLGNLVSRTLKMIESYFEGAVPDPAAGANARDAEVARVAASAIDTALAQYDRFEFSRALETIWGVVAEVNKYLVENEPWAMAEDPAMRGRLAAVLYTAAEAVRVATVLAYPVIPHATEDIWRQLGQWGGLSQYPLDDLAWGQLESGTKVGEPSAVFPRVKKDDAFDQIENLELELRGESAPKPAPEGAKPVSDKIGIEDFAKVEMRVGQVKEADRVAGADKLLKLMVDIGDEVRQIVAGIAEVYKPEELVGRKVVVVTNLQPRKLRGVESNGMIVAASVPPDGKPVLAGFLEDVPVGARLK
jgi:methionyl-tRNA synthetase